MGTLYHALHENDIHDFTTRKQLETFLKERPHLFHFPSVKPKKNMGWVIKTKVNNLEANLVIRSEIETPANDDPDDLTDIPIYLEAVTGIMENNLNNANNSGRITLDDNRQAIMFKTDWVFHEIGLFGIHTSDIISEVIKQMKASEKFVVSGNHFCHLVDVLLQNPVPDRVARAIVEVLFDRHECESLTNVFDSLYPNIKKYLKSPEGLKGFVEFYPEIFSVVKDFVQLKEVPDVQLEVNQGDDFNDDNVIGDDDLPEKKLISSLMKIMTEMQHETENSRVMAFENCDRPFYKVNSLWEMIPAELKDNLQLTTPNDLMKILENYLHVFKLNRNYPQTIQTRYKLSESFPSEKIVSLEILRVKRRMPKAPNMNIFLNLSPICQKRIRDAFELSKFLELHNDFHYNWMKITDDKIDTTPVLNLDGLKNSSRNSINSEFELLKAQLHDLKSFVDEKSFRRNTKELFKEEFSIRFQTILEDLNILQLNLKTSNDEVQNEAFEEDFNDLAPPNEVNEENIMEI